MSDIRNRLGMRYDDLVVEQLRQASLRVEERGSSFFRPRAPQLDPRLVESDRSFNPQIRQHILSTLYGFWGKRYAVPETWSTVWVAGSALSWQWSDAGEGDLDVLIGVGMDAFRRANPRFAAFDEDMVASHFNNEFRNELTPYVAKSVPGFDMTFYVNPRAEDIRSIRPYAAYNLSADEWTVQPMDIPADWDPESTMPKAWWDAINAEVAQAVQIAGELSALRERLPRTESLSGTDVNTLNRMRYLLDQAVRLFDDIHTGRRNAFTRDGGGYTSYWNFRWQAHKRAGTVPLLHMLKDISRQATVRDIAGSASALADAIRAVHWRTQ